MYYDIVVPPTADGALEVTIVSWNKEIGSLVTKGEDLVEVVTEKITLYVLAPVNGVLKQILAPQGAKVRVGDVIGIVTEAQEEH